MSRESAVESFPALTVPPSLDAWKKWERQQASRRSSLSTKGPKGDSAKGGSKSGKVTALPGHCPDAPSTSKAESPGRSRLAALESGFSSFRAEMASMFASLQGRLTAPHPPGPKTDESRHRDGGARGGGTFPEDPLASQQPCPGLLGPEALPLVGEAPGCDLSDPSHVMEPRGPANHTATAMDPVHGLQSGLGQADFTQTTQRGGAVLRSGYGSEGTGEVSRGMGSTAFTGHQSQPQDVARQPFPVFDSAPSGVSALPGVSALSGFSALPGVSALPGLSGVSPNRTTATITSHTAPAVTMASYGGVSTSTSLVRPIPSLGIAQNNQVSAPSGQPQQQWSGSIPQGVQLPYTQGTNDIPMEQALNRVFPRGIPAVMEQFLAPTMEPDFGSFRRQSGQSSLDSVISLPELRYDVMARYPGYQVESSDPAPTKPTSFGLANFQQAKPAKEAKFPSLRFPWNSMDSTANSMEYSDSIAMEAMANYAMASIECHGRGGILLNSMEVLELDLVEN